MLEAELVAGRRTLVKAFDSRTRYCRSQTGFAVTQKKLVRCIPAPNKVPRTFSAGARRHVAARVFPFDQAWDPNVAAQSIAPQLFAVSLFPYLAFLYFLTKSGKAPKLTVIGFYFLLAFVGATIPAGIYAKIHYGTSLANVDWLHGAAESLLTITNLLVVLGLRQGIREAEQQQQQQQQAKALEQQQDQKQSQVLDLQNRQ